MKVRSAFGITWRVIALVLCVVAIHVSARLFYISVIGDFSGFTNSEYFRDGSRTFDNYYEGVAGVAGFIFTHVYGAAFFLITAYIVYWAFRGLKYLFVYILFEDDVQTSTEIYDDYEEFHEHRPAVTVDSEAEPASAEPGYYDYLDGYDEDDAYSTDPKILRDLMAQPVYEDRLSAVLDFDEND